MSNSNNEVNDGNGEIDKPLSWRMSPEESFSDWTMIITTTGNAKVSTEYDVHRIILAVGPSKSDYFARLFRMPTKERATNTSNIEFEKDAADAIPVMLDFMYTQELGIITTEQAVPLLYLAEYFGIKLLNRKVMSFVNEDMKIANVYRYLKSAKMFHDEKILGLSLRLCIENIKEMDTTSPLLPSLESEFFHKIITSSDIERNSVVSRHISTLVAAYCRLRQDELSQKMFDELTDAQHMPVIHKKCQ